MTVGWLMVKIGIGLVVLGVLFIEGAGLLELIDYVRSLGGR